MRRWRKPWACSATCALPIISNQLAKAANIGKLPLTPEVEEELIRTCAAVLAIRAELMRALGYTAEERE